MEDRYREKMRALAEAVLGTPGDLDPGTRSGIEARAASLGGRRGAAGDVPEALERFVEKVARHAYKVTDAEVAALRAAGYSEDAMFEAVLAAALGAAAGRLERGLAALRGEG